MSETDVTLNVSDTTSWYDSLPLLILALCVVIAVIAFLFGLGWLRRRQHAHERDHLVADIAEPETLRDLPDEHRP
jgi:hypothetical protein